VFWSASGLPELWILSERDLVGAAGRACSRAYVIQSCRKRQHSKLRWRGGCVLECSGLPELWIAPERELVGAAERACSRADVIQSGRKRASRQHSKLRWRSGCVLECSGLPELWTASERELVGAAGTACSRACAIQSGRKRASASTPNLGGEAAVFWSASGLPELWIAVEQEHAGTARPTCSRAYVIQSGRKRQHSKLGSRDGCVLECFRLDRGPNGQRSNPPRGHEPDTLTS